MLRPVLTIASPCAHQDKGRQRIDRPEFLVKFTSKPLTAGFWRKGRNLYQPVGH